MRSRISIGRKRYGFDIQKGVDISIPVQRMKGVSAFGIAPAVYRTYKDGSFIGDVHQGGSCNLDTITFTPHGNGTHTECLGHISKEAYNVNECIEDLFYPARLFSAALISQPEGSTVDLSPLQYSDLDSVRALIVRTIREQNNTLDIDYTGNNPPYVALEDVRKLADWGIEHLVLDLPSIDKEDDPKLIGHHAWWNYPSNPRLGASITEFALIPNELKDGLYLLKLNIGNFISDAAPSKPVLYALNEEH